MKYFLFPIVVITFFSCGTQQKARLYSDIGQEGVPEPLITQSLFNDKSATISEDNIQRILDGNYKMPQRLRVAIVRLADPKRNLYWNDEEYIKNEQSNIEILSTQLKRSPRVSTVAVVPELMISKPLSITNLREAGVRMQADVIVIFSSLTDIYSKYKLFTKADIKAFATTQALVLDTRTSLVPFTYVSTKDFLSQKTSNELNFLEARKRIQNEAVKLTMEDIGTKVVEYFK
ncbi:hypothetical protein [Segetibacter aerophilus]|uniref:Lipoprotein n=1 Tax=Segetibacter aerophilus TaxID=670293 RepID=A0A512BHZ7_9BACT|nr:hypothetical protein [Segetibacter aerophilus]GEO11609.1 hypothetical protein SAE01_41050 [Segetibacter aerophilus]